MAVHHHAVSCDAKFNLILPFVRSQYCLDQHSDKGLHEATLATHRWPVMMELIASLLPKINYLNLHIGKIPMPSGKHFIIVQIKKCVTSSAEN